MRRILLALAFICCVSSVSAQWLSDCDHECCAVRVGFEREAGEWNYIITAEKPSVCDHFHTVKVQMTDGNFEILHLSGNDNYAVVNVEGHEKELAFKNIEVLCGGESYDSWSNVYGIMVPYDADDYTADILIYAAVAAAIAGTIIWFDAAISPTPPEYQNEYLSIGAGMGTSYGLGWGVRANARYHAIGAHLGLGLFPFFDSEMSAGNVYSAGLQLHINRAYIDLSHIGVLSRSMKDMRYDELYGSIYQPSYTAITLGSNDVVRGKRWFMNMGFGIWYDNYTEDIFPSFEIGFGYRIFSNGYK